MKRVLQLALALMTCSGAAVADQISVNSYPEGYGCILNLVPEVNTYYVVDNSNPGATATHFKIHNASGLIRLATHVTPGYVALGNWEVDMTMWFPFCVTGSHVLMTLDFLRIGDTTPTCENYFDVVAAPTSEIPGSIVFADCATPSSNLRAGYGCPTYFGTDPNGNLCRACGCSHPPLSTSETTWGAVKALYRLR